jgi:hypothetical protein
MSHWLWLFLYISNDVAQSNSSDWVENENTSKRKRSENNEESGGSVASTSMAVQISANRAQRADNRATINLNLARREMVDMKAIIVNMRDAIGAVEFCPPCWLTGQHPNHCSVSCNSTAEGWFDPGSKYRSFRAHIDIPPGHCYSCSLPQVNCLPVESSPAKLLMLFNF